MPDTRWRLQMEQVALDLGDEHGEVRAGEAQLWRGDAVMLDVGGDMLACPEPFALGPQAKD